MIHAQRYPNLSQISTPEQLRELDHGQLQSINDELRAFLIETVAHCGGHFAAGLGCVELTVALHHCFNTPHDRLVWDVGHQAYPHKILTGRAEQITTIKRRHGLAPFPKRQESDYDAFGVGHSSTSISAALGMAMADKLLDRQRHHIAIIGDGGLTAGMAYEALHHAGDLDVDLLVILNDNDMAISPNVGGISKMLAGLNCDHVYRHLREGSEHLLSSELPLEHSLQKWTASMKSLVTPCALFEGLGFNYSGPIDGHNLPLLTKTLNWLKQTKGPRLLHIITQKGKGYAPAEADPIRYHAVRPFDPRQGLVDSAKPPTPTYSEVFGQWLCDMAEAEDSFIRHHPGHAGRFGHGRVRTPLSPALCRCWHCRTACGHAGRRHGLRRRQTGGGHLFHLPAARLRSAYP